MKSLFKRITSTITALAMTMSLFNGIQLTSFAEETEEPVSDVSITVESEVQDGLGSIYDVGMPISFFGMNHSEFNGSYKNQLDATSQAVYDKLYSAYSSAGSITSFSLGLGNTFTDMSVVVTIENETKKVSLSNEASQTISAWAAEVIVPAYLALIHDHPELSWLVNVRYQYRYSMTVAATPAQAGTYTRNVTVNDVEFNLAENFTNTGAAADITSAVSNAKAAINAKISNSTSRYDIVKGIHDYLCETIEYNKTAASDSQTTYSDDQLRCYQTAYSAFYPCNGDSDILTVCAGYAKGFKVLCDSYGIPCVLVTGDAGGAHAWNYVQMEDNNWYAIDATWDDQGIKNGVNDTRTDYLLCGSNSEGFNDETFGASHTPSGAWSSDYPGYVFSYPVLSDSAYENVTTPTVTGLTYTGTLAKTEYFLGQTFDPTGLSFALEYSDGSTEDVDVNDITFSQLQLGDTSVTATYDEYSVVITGITVEANYMTGIAIKTEPVKTSYTGGETLDMSGLAITVSYANGMTKDVEYDPEDSDMELLFSFEPTLISRLRGSDNQVTVNYYDLTATFPITVTKGTVTAEYAGYTEYEYGSHDTLKCSIHNGTEYTYDGKSVFKIVDVNRNQIIEADGEGISGTLLNGTQYEGQATNDDVIFFNEANGFNAGEYKVMFKYLGCDYYEAFDDFVELATITITQAEPEVSNVSVASPAEITAGLTFEDITLTCSSDVNGDIRLDPEQTIKAGTHSYNWTFTPASNNYKTVTGTIQLTVALPELEATYSGTTAYTYGDTADIKVSLKDGENSVYEGTSVFKLYKSGNTATPVLTSNGEAVESIGCEPTSMIVFINNGEDMNFDAGTYEVHFEYLGSENYAAKDYGKVAEITVSQATEYNVTINATGGPIYTTSNPEDVVMQGFADFGIPEIKVTHTGTAEFADDDVTLVAGHHEYNVIFTPDTPNAAPIEATVSIVVTEDEVEEIAVKTEPKTEYTATEEFDPTGLVLTVKYKSGKTTDVTYSDENKGEFAFDKTTLEKENTAVTVTYSGKTTTVPVTVTNVVTIDISKLSTLENSSGIGWEWDKSGLLTLSAGFEFKIEGENNDACVDNYGTIISGTFTTSTEKVYNYGTITGGTFNKVNNKSGGTISGGTFNGTVDNIGTITGGTFARVGNFGTIEITNGSVTIDKCIEDTGTVTVDGVKHEHNLIVKSYDNFTDETHNKNEACENCPINYEKTTANEAHKWIYTDGDILIRANCECGQPGGSVTLVEPADLNYTGIAKAATLTGEIKGVDVLPEIKYYDVNGTEAEPRNVGAYTAKITIDEATAELEFIIEKVVPEVTVTATSNGILYTSSTTADVTLTATATNPVSDTEVAGTIAFDGAIEFRVETNDYPVIFTPTDTNYDPVETTVSLTVEEDTLEGIAVTGTLAKTEYVEDDKFDPTGLTVTATYDSGKTKVIEHELLTIFPETLSMNTTSVMISYGENEVAVDGFKVRGKLAADKFKFTAPAANSEGKIVYDKTAKAATVTAADGVTGVGTITVRYFNGNTELDSAPVNAGTYKVVIDVALGENYVAATNISDASWTFTIEKADPVINPFISSPATVYDTTPVTQLSLKAGCSEVGGEISFDGDITLEVGTKNYPVIFYPMDGNNYNTVNGTVTIEVKKDTIESIAVKTYPQTAYTYGESFKPDGLVITATYLSGKTEDYAYDDDSAAFSFTPAELTAADTKVTVKYADKTTDITITVAKADPSYTIPTGLTAVYGDKLSAVALPTNWSWIDDTAFVGNVGTNEFAAIFNNKDENYNTVTVNVPVKVAPKTISIATAAAANKVYDGTTIATVGSVTFTGVLSMDSISYTATGEFADKNAGENKTVTVTVTLNETNYVLDSNTATATATISKADPPNITRPAIATGITGKPLSKAELPEGWVWDDATIIPVNGAVYGATYTPADTTNYNVIKTTVEVIVSDCAHSKTTEKVVDATCTTDGSKTIICDVCDDTVSTEIIPASHSWNTEYTVDTEATCTTDGQKSIHCSKCTAIKPDSEVVIPASHSWNTAYTVDKEATCTTDGQKSIHCSKCTEIKPDSEVVIPASHSWNTVYTIDKEATCTTDGQKSIHCSKCTEIKPDSVIVIPAEHDWNSNLASDEAYHWRECVKCTEIKDKAEHTGGTATPSSRARCIACGTEYGEKLNSELPNGGMLDVINPVIPGVTKPEIMGENGIAGWDAISKEIVFAQEGDTITVDMNGTTKLPKSVLKDIAGKNVYLVLDMGNGITWTINGETVTEPKNVDMRVSKNVKRIPVEVIDNVTGDNFTMEISLAHNGKLGFEAMLTISLGKKYNDNYANLYYYNPEIKDMEFIDSDLISKGEAQLIFGHASDYAIVIDEESLGDDVSSAAGVTAENEAMDTETVSVVFALPLVIAAGFVLRKKLCK